MSASGIGTPATRSRRLLSGIDPTGRPVGIAEHERRYGPLPVTSPGRLIEEVDRSGLRGRGGADFPTGRKLRTLAAKRSVSAVVVNGSETEPASRKDGLLMAALPHLVLDGAVVAAETVGADEVIITLRESARAAGRALRQALTERSDGIPVSVAFGPDAYVAGEESAVINRLEAGPPVPRFVPPRPFERGYRGKPTLIQNVETLAHLALIARYGAGWFREMGTEEDPGTFLATVSGAVAAPGVYELPFGTTVEGTIAAAGGPREPIQALLVGGYFGRWVRPEWITGMPLGRRTLADHDLSLGSGVLIALGASACGLHESARLARYLATQSAGQCGPCVHGLRAIAESFSALVEGVGDREEHARILRWTEEIPGRGACHHPDGAARLVRSALETFGDELAAHSRARCQARPAGLPLEHRRVSPMPRAIR
jgi:NADH:ubiquinone oxidoreductase subunit F (NADH-binding)